MRYQARSMEEKMRILLVLLALIISTPAPAGNVLQGSRESLRRQNAYADRMGWSRMTEEMLWIHKAIGTLVPLPADKVRIDPKLPSEYRWCMLHTLNFLADLAAEYERKFGTKFQVNSAVRTAERQRVLLQTNSNAARGHLLETRSPHLTGSVIDITKKSMTRAQREWMGKRLAQLEEAGHIEATEEFGQLVFHIMVYDWNVWYSNKIPA